MAKAIPGFEYDFAHIPVEVRAYGDPFAGDTEEEDKEAKDPNRRTTGWSFLKFLAWVFFVIFIIALILYVIIAIIDAIETTYGQDENKRLVKSRVDQ
mmetsp:Transcript_32864/g.29162  ORF Transcript_32864/g.29162 Transcript_32864/m.29162 type:complete len:97 (+) Transcript_32864:782-1072(+)